MTSLDIRLPNGKVIRYADEKAALFFVTDRSAVGANSYDAWVESPDNRPNAFTLGDLQAINRTMGGRSSAKHWTTFTTGKDCKKLKALELGWDLIEMSEDRWKRLGCADLMRDVLEWLGGPYRRAAMMTKMLHIKRSRLVPICDSYVAATMGISAREAESTSALIFAIREAGRANRTALRTVASRLKSIGVDRSLVRIFDVLLWFDAPPFDSPGPYALFEDWLVDNHRGRLFF